MYSNHTGFMKWPLSSASGGDNPTPTQGQETVFALNTIPKSKDGLASYLYGISILIAGDWIQSGGTGIRTFIDNFLRLLIASVSVRNAWHGTPVNTQWWLGAYLYPAEFVLNGYRRVQRSKGVFPAANATYPFSVRVFIPLCCGVGKKPQHTAQLALMYQDALLGVNMAAASVGTTQSPGSSFANLSMRATAYVGLDPEIRLGPQMELVDYVGSSTAGTSQEAKFLDYGNQTSLNGVMRSGGIVWANLVGNLNGCPGPVDVGKITRFSFPGRNQIEVSDVEAWYDEANDAIGPARPIGSVADSGGAAGTLYDGSGYPFILGSTTGLQRTQPIDNGVAFGLPVINPGSELEFSKIQTYGEAQSLYINTNTAPSVGQWHLLSAQLKRFTDDKREDLVKMVVDSGLAKEVLGVGPLGWTRKTLNKQPVTQLDERKTRYLPWRLINTSRRGRDQL